MRLPDVLAAALLAAILAGPATAHADLDHQRDAIHDALYLHWRTRYLSWTIQAGSAVGLSSAGGSVITPADVRDAMQIATRTWTEPTCTDLAFFYEGWVTDRETNMTTGKDHSDHLNKIVIREDDWVDGACDSGDAIACTTVVYRRGAGELLDADIDLNDRDFDFAIDTRTAPGAIDLVSVLTHETGHFLGFDHSDSPSSVMWGSIDPGQVRDQLAGDELAMLCETYPAGQCTLANDLGQLDCETPWQPAGCSCGTIPSPDSAGPAGALLLAALIGLVLRARRAPSA